MNDHFTQWKKLKKTLLRDTNFRKEYLKLGPRYQVIESLIRKRVQKELTQKNLAEKTGFMQSAIARLESGTYNPSLDLLNRIAEGLDCDLIINFREKARS